MSKFNTIERYANIFMQQINLNKFTIYTRSISIRQHNILIDLFEFSIVLSLSHILE